MPFEVLVRILGDSERGRAIQTIAKQRNVTPEQAIEEIIDAGIEAQPTYDPKALNGKTPAEMLLGLFSSPANATLMDEVVAIAYEGRKASSTRDIGL